MNRLLAEAYFHVNDFNNATYYFEKYMAAQNLQITISIC